MSRFILDNELNKIQKKGKKKQTTFKVNRIPFYILVLLICVSISLNSTYSADFVQDEPQDSHKVFIVVENGYQDDYELVVTDGSFRETIDSFYKEATVKCSGGVIEYYPEGRVLVGKNIYRDIKCTLAFDINTPKSSVEFDKLNTVGDNTGISYYYDKNAKNNYIEINYMMFRIIRFNGDGTIRAILDNNLDTVEYGGNDYLNSNALKVAREWYENNFADYAYIENADYDINEYDSYGSAFTSELIDYASLYYDKVGFISANELMVINGGNKFTRESYLYGNYFTSNIATNGAIWVVKDNGVISTSSRNVSLGVRPVINLRYSSLSGNGTASNPYVIEE